MEERLLEQGSPVRSYDTVSLSSTKGFFDMTDLAFRAKGYPNNTNLVAKGYTADEALVYLWAYGCYKYEVEMRLGDGAVKKEAIDASFEYAVERFKEKAIKELTFFW